MPTLPFAVLSGDGAVLDRAATKEAALRLALRRRAASEDPVILQIVWCKDGVPKLYLAFVNDDGVQKTVSWADE